MSGRMTRRLRGFSALERDDAAIDALARREPDRDEPDDAVRLLATWCQRIDEVPAPAADVLTAVVDRLPSRPSRWSFARSTAAATLTVSALLLGGVHAAEQARPGSTFWPLTQLLDRDRARSLVAFQRADGYLSHASTALEQGQVTSAATAVVQARAVIGEVRPEDGRPALTVRLAMLEGRISSLAGSPAAVPGQPPRLAHPTTSGGTRSGTVSPAPGGASADPTEGSASTPTAPAASTGSGTGGVGDGSGTGAPPGADLSDPSSPMPTAPGSPSPTAPPESAEPVGDDDTSTSNEPKTPKNTPPNKKSASDADGAADGRGDTNGDADGNADGDAYGNANGDAGGTTNGDAGGNVGGNASGQDRARRARGWSAPPTTST